MSEHIQTWLCIEQSDDGLRISNLPGGSRHCFFTSTPTHLPDCGTAALWIANPSIQQQETSRRSK